MSCFHSAVCFLCSISKSIWKVLIILVSVNDFSPPKLFWPKLKIHFCASLVVLNLSPPCVSLLFDYSCLLASLWCLSVCKTVLISAVTLFPERERGICVRGHCGPTTQICLVSVECVSLCAWAEMSALPLSVSGLVWREVWCPVTEPSQPAVSPSRPRFGWCVPVWPVVGRAARSNAGAHAGGSRHLAQRHAG